MSIKDRFPLVPCSRCGGSGTWSRCETWGTACFQCGTPHTPGDGRAFAKSAKPEVAEWQKAERAFRNASPSTIAVGDVIAAINGRPCSRANPGAVWVRVTAVDHVAGTPENNMGHSMVGDEIVHWAGWSKITVTTPEGDTITTDRINWQITRQGHADVDPFVERAWAALTRAERKRLLNPDTDPSLLAVAERRS